MAILILSVGIGVSYYVGYRKNLSYIKKAASVLEEALKPKDQTYTWLGGVIGFSGEYVVKGFENVHASLFLLPRQSFLYMPIALVTTRYDRLEILFYLKGKVWNEVHAVQASEVKRTRIFNEKFLKKEKIQVGGKDYLLYYRNRNEDVDSFLGLLGKISELGLVHMALTPEKSVLYGKFRVKVKEPGLLGEAVRAMGEGAGGFFLTRRGEKS